MPSRPYLGDADVQEVTALLAACRKAGRPHDLPTTADLREVLRVLADPLRDARLWQDAAGRPVGFAALSPNGSTTDVLFFVHPNKPERGMGVGAQVMEWAFEHAHEMAVGHSRPVRLSIRPREDDIERIALLERYGFARGNWRVLRYLHRLDAPIPEPRLPPGFAIRHVASEREVAEYVALHREAFGTANMTVEDRLALMRDPGYTPELDLVAVAPDGTWASFAVGGIDQEEGADGEEPHGYIDPIGTRPAFRRQGLARALVLENLRRLKARGVESVDTTTGGGNQTMQRLLESVGYFLDYTKLLYTKDVQP